MNYIVMVYEDSICKNVYNTMSYNRVKEFIDSEKRANNNVSYVYRVYEMIEETSFNEYE